MNEIKDLLPAIIPVLIFLSVYTHFHLKKKIKTIGEIKCNRCDYQGKAVSLGNLYSAKLGCPNCKSEAWKKI